MQISREMYNGILGACSENKRNALMGSGIVVFHQHNIKSRSILLCKKKLRASVGLLGAE